MIPKFRWQGLLANRNAVNESVGISDIIRVENSLGRFPGNLLADTFFQAVDRGLSCPLGHFEPTGDIHMSRFPTAAEALQTGIGFEIT